MKIAIDGPAGAGKSTIAKKIACELNFLYLDTGAMYRSIAYGVIKNNIDPKDREAVVSFTKKSVISFKENCVFLNDKDVTDAIRTPETSKMTSQVSVIREVRILLVEKQREIASQRDVVMDGRDIGSVVLPDAEYKFYLDADIDVRASRRKAEMEIKEEALNFKDIKNDMLQRDHNDMSRAESPLICVKDAVRIDTSLLSISEVCKKILSVIKGDNDAL